MGKNFIASDVSALLSATRRVIYLEDGDAARITRDVITLLDRSGKKVRASGACERPVAGLAGTGTLQPFHAKGQSTNSRAR